MKRLTFSDLMFLAFLEHRKTHTRRVIHPQPGRHDSYAHGLDWKRFYFSYPDGLEHLTVKPAYLPGETVAIAAAIVRGRDNSIRYRANGELATHLNWKWKSSTLAARFCPWLCCRYQVKITGVRAQRLHDINEADAIAEGIIQGQGPVPGKDEATLGKDIFLTATHAYAALWDTLHKKPGERWQDNPWVFVYGFINVTL